MFNLSVSTGKGLIIRGGCGDVKLDQRLRSLCSLSVVRSPLSSVVRCLLSVVRCLLSVVCCQLSVDPGKHPLTDYGQLRTTDYGQLTTDN